MTEKRFMIDDAGELIDLTNVKFIDYGDEVCDLLNDLSEENDEFKNIIRDVLELFEKEINVFSDKATEHDITAYDELRRFDNKDAFDMAVGIKKAIKLLKELNK